MTNIVKGIISIEGKPVDIKGMFRFPDYAAQIALLTKSIESKIKIKKEPQGFSVGFENFQWYVHDTDNAHLYKDDAKKPRGKNTPKKARVIVKETDNIGLTPITEDKEIVPCEKLDEALFLCIAKWNKEKPNHKILVEASLATVASAFIKGLDTTGSLLKNDLDHKVKQIRPRVISSTTTNAGNVMSRLFSKIPTHHRVRDRRTSSDSSMDSSPTTDDASKTTTKNSPRRF